MHPDLICLVLSLESAVERRDAISTSLKDLGIPFDFINGIDARVSDVSQHPDIDASRPCNIAGRHLRPGELACSLGHVLAYRRFLATQADYALIFEDDAMLTPDLSRFVQGQHYRGSSLIMLHHHMAQAYRYGTRRLFGHYRLMRAANSPYRTCAYVLDRPTAERLLAANTPVRRLADWPLPAQDLGCLVVEPMLVGHPPEARMPSLIGDRSATAIRVKQARRLKDYLTLAYLQRKWRKMAARRIS